MKWFTLYAPVKGIEEIDRLALTNMHPSRILDYWVLQFVLKGRRTVRIGNEMITATAGEYFFSRLTFRTMAQSLTSMILFISIFEWLEKKFQRRIELTHRELSCQFAKSILTSRIF